MTKHGYFYSIYLAILLKYSKNFTQIYQYFYSNLLPPNHLVDYPHVALDNLDYLGGNVWHRLRSGSCWCRQFEFTLGKDKFRLTKSISRVRVIKGKNESLILVPHVILLFLVAGEDSDFRYVNYCLLICISIASGLSDAKNSASLTTRAR